MVPQGWQWCPGWPWYQTQTGLQGLGTASQGCPCYPNSSHGAQAVAAVSRGGCGTWGHGTGRNRKAKAMGIGTPQPPVTQGPTIHPRALSHANGHDVTPSAVSPGPPPGHGCPGVPNPQPVCTRGWMELVMGSPGAPSALYPPWSEGWGAQGSAVGAAGAGIPVPCSVPARVPGAGPGGAQQGATVPQPHRPGDSPKGQARGHRSTVNTCGRGTHPTGHPVSPHPSVTMALGVTPC